MLGQLIQNGFAAAGLDKTDAGTATSMSLVVLSVLLTGFSLYDDLAKVAGAGTLVPLPALPTPSPHRPLSSAAKELSPAPASKLFSIAGPVLVFGISASAIYGLIYWLSTSVF